MRIPELAITLKENPDIIYQYASKFINTHDIAQQYKERSNKHDIYGMGDSIPYSIVKVIDHL
ncbi:27357_t:CDS:1, partial [Gigaspora margarita]